MCTEAVVLKNGKAIYCESVGELAKALGVRQEQVSADPFDCCLCNAYWNKLGARHARDEENYLPGTMVIEQPNTKGQP